MGSDLEYRDLANTLSYQTPSGDDASGLGRGLEVGAELEISCVYDGTGPARFGGAGEVVYLAGGDVMEVEVRIGERALRQVFVKLHH